MFHMIAANDASSDLACANHVPAGLEPRGIPQDLNPGEEIAVGPQTIRTIKMLP